VQAFTTQAFALDMLRIGFNGTHRAKTTNPKPTRMAKMSTSAGMSVMKTCWVASKS
jgi:hypothetical protein